MRHPDLPTTGQRLRAAEVTGEVQRMAFGRDRPERVEQAVARLREITTDPQVLGHVLGSYLVKAETSQAYQPAVDMLAAAGADTDVAAVKAAWVREQITLGRIL